MKTILSLQNANRFSARLKLLREQRRNGQNAHSTKRKSLTKDQRKLVLAKTGSRCHICGGKIRDDENWQADHVLAHALGGEDLIGNYLAAHFICNNYRWHYGPEEFQWILKLGVWIRTLIEKRESVAMVLAERFVKHEQYRMSRQKTISDEISSGPVLEE